MVPHQWYGNYNPFGAYYAPANNGMPYGYHTQPYQPMASQVPAQPGPPPPVLAPEPGYPFPTGHNVYNTVQNLEERLKAFENQSEKETGTKQNQSGINDSREKHAEMDARLYETKINTDEKQTRAEEDGRDIYIKKQAELAVQEQFQKFERGEMLLQEEREKKFKEIYKEMICERDKAVKKAEEAEALATATQIERSKLQDDRKKLEGIKQKEMEAAAAAEKSRQISTAALNEEKERFIAEREKSQQLREQDDERIRRILREFRYETINGVLRADEQDVQSISEDAGSIYHMDRHVYHVPDAPQPPTREDEIPRWSKDKSTPSLISDNSSSNSSYTEEEVDINPLNLSTSAHYTIKNPSGTSIQNKTKYHEHPTQSQNMSSHYPSTNSVRFMSTIPPTYSGKNPRHGRLFDANGDEQYPDAHVADDETGRQAAMMLSKDQNNNDSPLLKAPVESNDDRNSDSSIEDWPKQEYHEIPPFKSEELKTHTETFRNLPEGGRLEDVRGFEITGSPRVRYSRTPSGERSMRSPSISTSHSSETHSSHGSVEDNALKDHRAEILNWEQYLIDDGDDDSDWHTATMPISSNESDAEEHQKELPDVIPDSPGDEEDIFGYRVTMITLIVLYVSIFLFGIFD